MHMRNTIDQERSTCIALINIERDYERDIDAIITDFVLKTNERKKIYFEINKSLVFNSRTRMCTFSY